MKWVINMKKEKIEYIFENKNEKNLTIIDVKERIKEYIEENEEGKYKIMIGTDSQGFSDYTKFVTALIIKKEGKPLWNCHMIYKEYRRIKTIRRKISLETSFTEKMILEIKSMLENTMKDKKKIQLELEGHIDVGLTDRSKTKIFAKEMIERIEKIGAIAKTKPNSMVASSYANRFTK